MASESEKICEGTNSPPAPVERHQTEVDVPNNERTKLTRHPRWTRQETIILIEAKKVVENGGKSVCRYTTQSEPKWDLVSSLCHRQGVNRGPVQCRKRWSNLLSDFKKIKKWESNIKEEAESFWVMRNDERKERKLPGFFDAEVYNVLDGGVCTAAAFPLTLIKMKSKAENTNGVAAEASEQCEEEEEEEAEAIVDSEKMGWSTEEETITTGKKVTEPLIVSVVKETNTIMRGNPKKTSTHPLPSSVHEEPEHLLSLKSRGNNIGSGKRGESMSKEGCKRRRLSPDNCEDNTNFSNPLIKVLRRNGNILKAHLGDQNISYQLARDQQKEQTDNVVAALGKLTDALIKIAEKL